MLLQPIEALTLQTPILHARAGPGLEGNGGAVITMALVVVVVVAVVLVRCTVSNPRSGGKQLGHYRVAPGPFQERPIGGQTGRDEIHSRLDLRPDDEVDGRPGAVDEGILMEEGGEPDDGGDQATKSPLLTKKKKKKKTTGKLMSKSARVARERERQE
jgi:hypothetical protein